MEKQSQLQRHGQVGAQLQRVMMTPQMQQAIQVMQMPVMELSSAIEMELAQNPLLESELQLEIAMGIGEEFDEGRNEDDELSLAEDDFEILKRLDEDFRDHFDESESYQTQRTSDEQKLKLFLEQSIQQESTFFEHLMGLARESFESKEELLIAEELIGNIDERGYFQGDLEEIGASTGASLADLQAILGVIQTFEPIGVGARDYRECLMIQIRSKGNENSIAGKIVDGCFDDLLHNRIPVIAKKLKLPLEELERVIHDEISKLECHPGLSFGKRVLQQIVPDVILEQDGDNFRVVVEDEFTPSLRINRRYLKMLDDPSISDETQAFVRQKLVSAKWLLRNLSSRHDTIERITQHLVNKQRPFFDSAEGKLVPMKMKEVALALELHESTIARAVANKYLFCFRGLLPLRSFFTNCYVAESGEALSSTTVRDALHRIIQHEDKEKPLSDEKLSLELKTLGIPCARRTVAKYRCEFGIGNSQQRRRFS